MDKSPISFQSSTVDPQNPQSIALARALMKAQYDQAMGQSLMDEGSADPGATQFVPGNQWGPAVAVRQSPFAAMGRAAEKMTGAYMSKHSMEQMLAAQLQQAQVKDAGLTAGLTGLAGGSAPGAAPAPQQLAAAMVPKGLDYAQLMQESGMHNNAISSAGARGVAQIMPATAADPGFGVHPLEGMTRRITSGKYAGMLDPSSAPIENQIGFMGDYREHMPFKSEYEKLQAYNAGPGKMQQVEAGTASMPAETAAYAPNIMRMAGYQPPSQPPAAPAQAAPPQQPAQSSNFTPEMGQFAAKLQHLVTYNGLSPELAKAYWERAYPGMTPDQINVRDPQVMTGLPALEGAKTAAQEAAKAPYTPPQAYPIGEGGANVYMTPQQANARATGGTPQAPVGQLAGIPAQQAAGGAPQANGMSAPNPVQLEAEKAGAVDTAKNLSETEKTFNAANNGLPYALQRLNAMRTAAPDASSGFGLDETGTGVKQEALNSLGSWLPSGLGGDSVRKTTAANALLTQKTAQQILPEIAPIIANSGMKGNRMLLSLGEAASGLNPSLDPNSKVNTVQGIEDAYVSNLKSMAKTLRDGGRPAPTEAEIDAAIAKEKASWNKPQTQTQASPVAEGQTAINKQTGQRIIFKGGAWQPQ
jgi:hypothetical protein